MRIALSLLVLAATTGCTSIAEVPTKRIATVELRSGNGLPAGTAILLAAGDRVSLNIAAAGLSAGEHGTHLHAVGRCAAPDFASAGSHLNPGKREHGTVNPNGSHFGDLPNIKIGGSGAGSLSIDLAGTRAEIEAALFDADGSALVIHAAPDDYRTDPTGNSGARLACGVVRRST